MLLGLSVPAAAQVSPDDVIQMNHVKREVAEFGNDEKNGGVRISVGIGDGLSPKGHARTISYTVGGTATRGEGKDYTITGKGVSCPSSDCSVELPANTHSAQITIYVNNDGLDENDETIVFTLKGGSGYTVNNAKKTTTVTIEDDDTRGLTFHRRWADVDEGSSGNITVRLSSQPTAAVTVKIVSNNQDVTVSPTSLTFNPTGGKPTLWSTARTVTVSAAQDDDAVDDTATLTYTTSGGDYGGANALSIDRPVSVDDDDTADPAPTTPVASFASSTSSAAEDAGTRNVTVNISPAPSGGLTLGYSVGGTATAGSGNDFTIQNSGSLTIAAGATSATIPVAISDDSTDENAETVILTLTGGTGYTLGSTTVHTLTITDNDGTGQATLSLSGPASANEGNSGTSDKRFTVSLSKAPSRFVSWQLCFTGTATIDVDGGAIAAGADYQPISGQTPIDLSGRSPVCTSRSFSSPFNSLTNGDVGIRVKGDTDSESDETVIATLSISDGPADVVLGTSVATYTIRDDDPQPGTQPVITIAGGNAVTEGTAASFTLTASPVPTTNLTVNLEVEDSADFVASIHEGTNKMVTIGTSGTATYTVPTDNDNTDESNGSVKVTVKTGTGYTVGSTDSAKVTVNDDDPAPGTPGLVISRNTLSVSEGGTGSYTVKLQTAPTGTVTVNIASNNADVTVSSASLTFNANGSNLWNTAQTVTVSAAQDNDDANDSATLTHTASGGSYGSVTATLDVTVTDNETRSSSKDDEETQPSTQSPPPNTGTGGVPPSAPVISISGGVEVEEGEVLLYRIISEEPVEQDTEVKIKVEQRGEYTEPAESTVTIKEGEKEAVYEVTTTDDSIDEEDGEVTVTVLSGTGYNIGTSSSATLEVRDNDNAGIKVSEAKLSVSGEGGRVSYTVVLTSEPVLEVRVEPYSQNSSVVVVSGALVFTKENWDREQTVTVRGNESGSTVIGHRISSEDNTYSSVKTENVEVRVEDKKKEEGAGEWTGRFGRTVAERVVEAVSRRMEWERESRVEIAGVHPVEKRPESIWGEQEQESLSLEEVLLASSFEAGRKDSAVFWANASRSSFEGRREGWSGDGNVTMGVGGADWNTESMLGGLMIIRADGSGDYGGSSIDAHITGVAPYAGGKISDYMSIWGTVGVGRGEIRVEEGNERWSSDIGWKMAAGGIRGEIVTRKAEGLGLAFVSDVLYAKSDSEDYFEEGVSRIRVGVEGSWTAKLSESALFEPRVEAGIRRDGGDAERGMGAELGGGMKLRHTELGITVDIEGRGLVSHEDGGFESRGISASFEWEKDMSEGRGASVALRQDWGEPQSGGMESLFYDGPIRGGEVSSNGSRLSAEAEYGFMREGMRQAPYVDYGQWEEGRDYALGWRVSTISSDVSVDVNATRRESEQSDTEHGVGVRLDVRW